MNNIINLIREDLKNFVPYSSARSTSYQGKIWLNANELPWENNFSTNSIQLNRYPQQQPSQLKEKLANYYQIQPNQCLITRGSGEAIDLLIRLFCQAQRDAILICPPTFGMYETLAKLQGANIVKVPLCPDDFQIHFDLILKNWCAQVKIVFLCSPNNPTGNLLTQNDLLKLCTELRDQAVIVVDEAYIEFSSSNSGSQYIGEFDNLVILRTLSKAFGLASARLGIMIANQELLVWLQKILAPYPLGALSIQAALSMLETKQLFIMQQRIEIIIRERQRLLNQLKNNPAVSRVWSSQANFILVQFKHSLDAECQQAGIVLRDMSQTTHMSHCYRISIGTPEENNHVITMLEQISC